MTECDGATVGVDLRRVRAGLLEPREHDRRERLVDLDDVDVVDGHAGLVEGVLGGRDRRGEHHHGVVAAHGQVVDAGSRCQIVFLQRAFGDDEGRRRPVGDLRGDGRGEPGTIGEDLQAGHLLHRGLARAFVDDAVTEGDVLVVELAVGDRGPGPLVRLQRPALHVLATDVPLLRHHVGAEELRDLRVAETFLPAGGFSGGRGESELLARDHRLRDRDGAHVLQAAGDDDVLGSAHDALRCEVDGLLAGPALPVDGGAGHLERETGCEPGGPGDVARLATDGVEAAEHHVVDGRGVDAGALDECGDDVGAEIGGVGLGQ